LISSHFMNALHMFCSEGQKDWYVVVAYKCSCNQRQK
jgi:hypothetical protein